MTTPPHSDIDARLAALEGAVDALRQEIVALRAAGAGSPDVGPGVGSAPSVSERQPLEPRADRGGIRHSRPDGLPDRLPGAAQARPLRGARLRAAARAWATGLGVPALPDDRAGLEVLVGRYAAVGVGALVLLMGVGAFLTWAVANFTLAPATRVALGAVGAAALAALGERLRRRAGARRFGEVLLALALAVVHVDAWAAGPYLQIVPAELALGVALAASVALTALAWRARQQSLFVVGVGGALLAPFVSGASDVHPIVRPVYGWLVLTLGLAALVHGSVERRPWHAAGRLLALGVTVYAVAQLGASSGGWAGTGGGSDWLRQHRTFEQDLAPAFALACASGPLAALAWRARRRTPATPTDTLLVRLTLADLSATVLALWATAGPALRERPALIGWAFAAAVAAHATFALPAATVALAPVMAGLVLPLATLAAALAALVHVGTPRAAAVAACWTALSATLAAVTWRRARRAGPPLAATGLASALMLVLWTHEHDALRVALLGAHAALTAAVFARVPGRGAHGDHRPLLALASPLVVLVGASAWSATLLHDRPAFAYVPFLTAPSAAAGAVVLGWAVCAAVVWRAGNELLPHTERAGVVAVAATVALLWGREELARAVAPDVATVLLVGYFAVAGLAALALGRARRVPAVRQAGLALALYAALKAMVEVSQLEAVALRVVSYLLVGGFLLGVGYWYRGAGRDEDDAASAGLVRPAGS